MKNEKLALIIIGVIIVGALFAYITTNEDLFGGSSESKENLPIELGDCVDVNYIAKFDNGTIFSSSYNDTANKTGGKPLKIFVSTNESESSPPGYPDYKNLIDDYYVKGFIEGLVGLKEGDSAKIGPIPPADAYGVFPKVGDTFTISDPSYDGNITFKFVKIITNTSMPDYYVDYYGSGNTTLFVLRFESYSVGEKTTTYLSWENATVVTKINDTKLWTYTTPPADKTTNFTWISMSADGYYGILFPENSSSVTSINDTTIIVTHNPEIGAKITELDYNSGYTYDFTVLNLTDDAINTSYLDESTGDLIYYDFNRTVTINRNVSENITYIYPIDGMGDMISYFKTYYGTDLDFGVSDYADKNVTFQVKIEKVYKTSL